MTEEKKNEKQQEAKSEPLPSDAELGKKEESHEDSAELKDRLLRLAAEFDNYKKRAARELDASKSMGKAELLKKILPTLDELELALASLDRENSGSKKGIELVYSNLMDALKAEGLEVMKTDGKFDPYRHEIMLVKESNKGEGTIIEVVRKGYLLNGIMLRPASVIVAKGKQEDAKENKNR